MTTDSSNCDKSRTYHKKLEKASRRQTTYHSLEFTSLQLDDRKVVVLRNAEVLLVKIHQFHLVVRNHLLVRRLEHEVNGICLILGLHGDNVIVSNAPIHISFSTKTLDILYIPENLSNAIMAHAHGELTVTTELVKSIGSEVIRHQGNVRVVNSLELDATVTAVQGGFLQHIL